MDDDLLRNRLAEAFRRSSRNPQHLAFLVLPIVETLLREAKAEAWDEGHAASERDWRFSFDLVTPDEERQPLTNPYRD